MGLIHVMENLTDPSRLGEGIAVAFVATIYGVGSANLLLLPIATKMEVRHRHEMIINEMILEGIVALSTGENPRLIEEKLISFIPNLQKLQKDKHLAPGREGVRAGNRPLEGQAAARESQS